MVVTIDRARPAPQHKETSLDKNVKQVWARVHGTMCAGVPFLIIFLMTHILCVAVHYKVTEERGKMGWHIAHYRSRFILTFRGSLFLPSVDEI